MPLPYKVSKIEEKLKDKVLIKKQPKVASPPIRFTIESPLLESTTEMRHPKISSILERTQPPWPKTCFILDRGIRME